jgi:hypothetical protein
MDFKGFATYLISKVSEAASAYESGLLFGPSKTNEEIHNTIGICRALRGFINDIPIHLDDFTKKQDDANNNIFSTPNGAPVPVSDADVTVLPPVSGGEAA